MTLSVEHDYACAGFGRSLKVGARPALLIVDVVMAYLTPDSPLYSARFTAALRANETLLEAARRAGIPVIFTSVEYAPDGRDGGVFFRKLPLLKCFVKGSPLGAFPETLQPLEDELIVVKHYASAFYGTSLAATLTSLQIDTVFVTGYSTSGCVRATAVDAMQAGFVPFVVREACGDRDARPHESNLFDLQSKYAEVIDLEAAVQAMLTAVALPK